MRVKRPRKLTKFSLLVASSANGALPSFDRVRFDTVGISYLEKLSNLEYLMNGSHFELSACGPLWLAVVALYIYICTYLATAYIQ